MSLNNVYYQAYQLKDATFDGLFFIGVISTRIYCRPVCTAKMPKQKNCRFFPTAATAQEEGFRPCRRCRPELVPGFASVDMAEHLAKSAKKLIETSAFNHMTIEQLAARLGISTRHLHRLFTDKFGISPSKFIQNYRLSLAKQLLTETDLTVVNVALKVGFSSVRQFNALFKRYYHISPTHYRCGTQP